MCVLLHRVLKPLFGRREQVGQLAGGVVKETDPPFFGSLEGVRGGVGGIFDVDEFFDILHDEPLDKWYRMGNVIAIVDAKQEQQLSPQSAYLLASETANAGMVVLSRSQLATPAEMDSTVNYLNHALEQNGCARRFGADVLALLPDGLRQTLEKHRELYDMGRCRLRQQAGQL